MVLKSCKQHSCVHPWESLHPSGSVHSLRDALDPAYDGFYRDQVKVSYTKCEGGYIVESEGPQDFFVYNTEAEGTHNGNVIYDTPGQQQQQQVLINPNWSLWE